MPSVAGVDSSTQSTKIEIRDAETGELATSARAPHPPVRPPSAEQDPRAWWTAFTNTWEQLRSPEVAAISIAAQQHGCVVTNGAVEPVRPAKLWCDTTTAPDAEWLRDQLPDGAAGWAQACGSVPVAAFTITKLSWLHRAEPETWSAMRHVCLPHDWLTHRLTGELTTDRGDASGTGYWSPAEGRYRFDLLAIVDDGLDWAPMLPRVLDPLEPAGTWNGALVAPGTGDNMAAALGLGLGPGDVVVSIGTSGTVATVSEHPTADPTGAVAGFADATGRFLPLVCTLNATKVTDAVAAWLGVDLDALDALALDAPAGADGLTLLPYLDGERTPDRPTATGTLTGLGSGTERSSLARAAYEGVVCGLLDGLDALAAHTTIDDGRLWLVGGGARSAAYRQVLADVSGRPVITTDLDEIVATGACVQAAATLLGTEPAQVHEAWGLTTQTTEPGPGSSAADEIRGRYAVERERSA